MTKFIFHGGGIGSAANSNDSFYAELVKDIPQNGTVLLVYFASRTDNTDKRALYDEQKCKAFATSGISVIVATLENFSEQIDKADAVFLRGGSTEKLLAALRQYPNLQDKFLGKTIAGSSAGAYALSTYFSSHYRDIAQEGLGIAPVRVVTHFGSTTMPPRPGAIEALKHTAENLPLIICSEGEWKAFSVGGK